MPPPRRPIGALLHATSARASACEERLGVRTMDTGAPMKRRLLTAAYLIALLGLSAAYVRSAWVMPLRNYPFDFSINYTGARLLLAGGWDAAIYDRAALAAEAATYTGYTPLYTQLFLTYIQTPLTAVLFLPVAGLTLDEARFAVLAVSNLMLLAGAAVTLWALRPTRLTVLAAFVIFGTYEAMFDSLRLGNMDGIIVLMIALAFLALRRGRPWLIGAPLALAAMLKMSPAIILGYFAWRRDWRVLIGAAVAGLAILTVSVAVAGPESHLTFVREIAPRLSKGSTFYDNISLGGATARAYFGETSWYYEDEVWPWPLWLRAATLAVGAAVVLAGYAFGRNDAEAGFMLATLSAVLVAPIAWSFYPTWLVPSLLFLVWRCERRRAWGRLALLAALYPLLAIVPMHFSELNEELYRWPVKTVALALYGVLLGWEALAAPLPARAGATIRRRARTASVPA